ncbi:hypothetical protein COCOBI_pt-0400 (chloroplast) [Coccomyxa sp. Obi]|nr:hypothetical protein COCOBI_pt-0400 [Coccomyxa sp. Obi]
MGYPNPFSELGAGAWGRFPPPTTAELLGGLGGLCEAKVPTAKQVCGLCLEVMFFFMWRFTTYDYCHW